MQKTAETLAYLAQGLRTRAVALLRQAQRALTTAQACALTATAYRALARAATLRADLMQQLGRIGPMCDAAQQGATYTLLASAYAHAADLRGA